MNCPFCSEQMECGQIYAPNGRISYWLPKDAPPNKGLALTVRKVKQRRGVILGEAGPVAMIAKRLPNSYYCKRCGCVITMLGEYAP